MTRKTDGDVDVLKGSSIFSDTGLAVFSTSSPSFAGFICLGDELVAVVSHTYVY